MKCGPQARRRDAGTALKPCFLTALDTLMLELYWLFSPVLESKRTPFSFLVASVTQELRPKHFLKRIEALTVHLKLVPFIRCVKVAAPVQVHQTLALLHI